MKQWKRSILLLLTLCLVGACGKKQQRTSEMASQIGVEGTLMSVTDLDKAGRDDEFPPLMSVDCQENPTDSACCIANPAGITSIITVYYRDQGYPPGFLETKEKECNWPPSIPGPPEDPNDLQNAASMGCIVADSESLLSEPGNILSCAQNPYLQENGEDIFTKWGGSTLGFNLAICTKWQCQHGCNRWVGGVQDPTSDLVDGMYDKCENEEECFEDIPMAFWNDEVDRCECDSWSPNEAGEHPEFDPNNCRPFGRCPGELILDVTSDYSPYADDGAGAEMIVGRDCLCPMGEVFDADNYETTTCECPNPGTHSWAGNPDFRCVLDCTLEGNDSAIECRAEQNLQCHMTGWCYGGGGAGGGGASGSPGSSGQNNGPGAGDMAMDPNAGESCPGICRGSPNCHCCKMELGSFTCYGWDPDTDGFFPWSG